MTSSTTRARKSGWWYPYIFVGAFGVVLAVNLIMAFSAIHTFSGLSTDNAYEKGLKYNDDIAAAKRQQALGWTVTTTLEARVQEAGSAHEADIVVTYLDRDGRPVTGLSVQAAFVRPTSEGHDSNARLAEQGQGRYMMTASLPLGGQWDMTVSAERGDAHYQFNQRINLP